MIYRAISESERKKLVLKKKFGAKAGGYEGKLFAESVEDASIFGKQFHNYDGKQYFIVEVEVDEDFLKKLWISYTDLGLVEGSTIGVDRDQLDEFNEKMTFKILNYGACV